MSNIAPGWYKDPAEPTTQRYWDGEGWIGAALPIDATPPEGPPEPERPRPEPAQPESATRTSQLGEAGAGANGAAPGVHGWPPVPPFPPGANPPEAAPPDAPPAQAPSTGPGTKPSAGPATEPPGAAGPPSSAPPTGWPAGPYPHPVSLPEPRPHGLLLASPGSRLVARLVDIAAVLALNVVVNGWFIYQYAREMAPIYREMNRRFAEGSPMFQDLPQPSGHAGNLQIVIILLAAALWFAYEVPAVANTGQTPGKRLLGIKVVRLESADRLGFGRSLRRWNTLGLPTLFWTCFGIGFVLQIVDCFFVAIDRPLRQALHDKSARTAVVHVGRTANK
ncbi:MAG TPA: RDD family protein [Micromonosporaceae bacterium]